MGKRSALAGIAAETVMITRAGSYTAPSGCQVLIGDAIQRAVGESQVFTPNTISSLHSRASACLPKLSFSTSFEVNNGTTFAAARRLVAQHGPDRVAALNFASARHPGGGFLNGSQAQEESLARASALHTCLERQMVYYNANRNCSSSLYTDHMIVSPRVPVFRDDSDVLVEEPWEVTVITAPAPNVTAMTKNEPKALANVEPTFRRRIENVLAAAVVFGQTSLVLGAWGCGVFGNNPAMVARLFGEFLLGAGTYSRAFQNMTFAVLDRGGDTIGPFADVFR